MKEPILCYVNLPWCYFTTKPLSRQWGDDWDDVPYEYNAGPPYTYEMKVAVDTNLVTPDDEQDNSPYSVEHINKGAVAWLFDKYGDSGVSIMAGTTLTEFKRRIGKSGGKVYSC